MMLCPTPIDWNNTYLRDPDGRIIGQGSDDLSLGIQNHDPVTDAVDHLKTTRRRAPTVQPDAFANIIRGKAKRM